MLNVEETIKELRLAFYDAHDRGAFFFSNLLLPEKDNGINELIFNELTREYQGSKEEDLMNEVVRKLKFLREECLKNPKATEAVQKIYYELVDEIARQDALNDLE